MNDRVYLVKTEVEEGKTQSHLVRAKSRAGAVAHVLAKLVDVEARIPTRDELIALVGEHGVPVEVAE